MRTCRRRASARGSGSGVALRGAVVGVRDDGTAARARARSIPAMDLDGVAAATQPRGADRRPGGAVLRRTGSDVS
jgi:hypothetical protein